MIRITRLIAYLIPALVLFGCGRGVVTQTMVTGSRSLSELYQIIDEEVLRAASLDCFRATAHLSYHEKDFDGGFELTIWHDHGHAFTRLQLSGVLDQSLWLDAVAFQGNLVLYMPLEGRILRGSRRGDIETKAGLQFSLNEVLSLVELNIEINTNGNANAMVNAQGESVLRIDHQDGASTMVGFSLDGFITRVILFKNEIEQSRLSYERRDKKTKIAKKQTLVLSQPKIEASIWLTSFDTSWAYHHGDEIIAVPPKTLEEIF